MKHYPSFDGKIIHHPVVAFGKLDGSNLRCEWNRKQGLHKFGSRKVLLGEDHPVMGRAPGMILDKYGDDLGRIFTDERLSDVTCYFEFWGERSFAGQHDLSDPTLTVTLLDIDVYKKGIPLARDFIRLFGDKVDIPPVLYTGNPTSDFLDSVRTGTLEGMPFEGVVCRGAPLKRGYQPHYFKCKSLAWVERVKAMYGNDPKALLDLL